MTAPLSFWRLEQLTCPEHHTSQYNQGQRPVCPSCTQPGIGYPTCEASLAAPPIHRCPVEVTLEETEKRDSFAHCRWILARITVLCTSVTAPEGKPSASLEGPSQPMLGEEPGPPRPRHSGRSSSSASADPRSVESGPLPRAERVAQLFPPRCAWVGTRALLRHRYGCVSHVCGGTLAPPRTGMLA